MKVAIGHSEDIESEDAIEEVLDACAASLSGRMPHAGLLYVAISHDFQLILDHIMARYPDLDLVGCTTDGELSSTIGFAEDSVVLMLFHSEAVRFGVGIGQGVRENPRAACQQAVTMASAGLEEPIRLCIANPDGLGTDMKAILSTLSEMLEPDVPICGGMAGDQIHFEQTYQFYKGSVFTNAVPTLLFAGALRVSTGVESGWVPMGAGHRITSAKRNIIHTIDGERAIDFWERYWGQIDSFVPHHFLAVYPNETLENNPQRVLDSMAKETVTDRDFYLCAPLRFQEDGSMILMNSVQSGAFIRFADVSRSQILDGTASSISKAYERYGNAEPDAILVYSCAGRRSLLGTRVNEEAAQLNERFGEDIPIAGFYTYGEFCPLPSTTLPQSHNSTFVTVVFGET